MTSNGQVATWLELASTAAQGVPAARRVRVHPVGGHGGECVAVSVNERLLHDGEGRITVFRGTEAAAHFLGCGGVPAYLPGAPAPMAVSCGDAARCLHLKRGRRLTACCLARQAEEVS
ncbi:hypothetical protein GPA19_13200 [Azoarcus indigens]|uniref:Uncharacterized protein n=1 Tax=Azoarcus indigens TaxID=29545 RepID=A0A4R6EF99_9RHOO|nr:hypothetical protein [Azoarcus indigens]NMG65902.1 hypothetical protein [Azoarcus indigens]TDN55948.1 hypothetical protein C7389_103286 [Azoarcus indigens]